MLCEVHHHDQAMQHQYDIPLEEWDQRIAVVTDATCIIQEQLTQGAQLVKIATQLWMVVLESYTNRCHFS